jgi:Ca2+-binding RTX toxin-like protein
MTTRGTALRAATVLAVALGGLAVAAAPATADHSVLELVSTGAAGGNGPVPTLFEAGTPDGNHAFFTTDESLVAADTDGGQTDIYDHTAGTTRLVTVGLPVLGGSPFFQNVTVSADGSRVFWEASTQLVPADQDAQYDVYTEIGDQPVLVTTGTGDTALDGAQVWAVSADGSRAVVSSMEALTGDDTDATGDLYLWQNGTLTRLTLGTTGGNGAHQSYFAGASADASVVVFQTDEQLVAADTDNGDDLYRRAGGQTTLVSTGPTGGTVDDPAEPLATSPDGSRVVFSTTDRLITADTDAASDVYLWANGVTTLLSAGTADVAAFFTDANRDLTTVGLSTDEALLPQDSDSEEDLYAWRNGTLVLLTTAPGHQANLDTRSVSDDGTRIVMTAFSALTGEPSDAADDLYLWNNGQTTLLTPGTSTDDARFRAASSDGSRIVFATQEALLGSDTDASDDLYEVSPTGMSQLTTGNGASGAFFEAAGTDGGRVYWSTEEPVVPADTDAADDIYLSRVAVPRNLTPPTITGSPGVGQTVTCTPGTWKDAESFAYRWNRDGAPVPGATGSTYLVPAGDASHVLTCTVTATGDGGSASATSAPVTVPVPTGPLPGACANAGVGTAGADTLRGTPYGDLLYGLAGRDRLVGLAGVDCLVGGPGRDRLVGGTGKDKLDGGKAADRLYGGPGRDRLRGSAGADVLNGGLGRDRLVGGLGDDVLRARDGRADRVRCGRGDDVAVADRRDRVSGCEVVRRG